MTRITEEERLKLPRKRKEARSLGIPYYYTGKPCVHGHYSERYSHSKGCVECKRYRSSEEYQALKAEPALYRERLRKYVSRKDMDPASHLLYQSRARAKKNNIPFNIDISDIVIPEFCPIFGYKLQYTPYTGRTDFTPSLDRIIPSKGYTKGNVHVISWRANHLKNNATAQEVELLYKFFKGLNVSSRI